MRCRTRLAVVVICLLGLGAVAGAHTIIKVMPGSVASGIFPFSTSYRLSLLDFAAGAEMGDRFAVAGGIGAVDYYGWWSNAVWFDEGPEVLPLPVTGYVLMLPDESDFDNQMRPYAFFGAYPLAMVRDRALVGMAGLGTSWNLYAVTVGAEFRTVVWVEHYREKTTYLLQLTFGLGGWYTLGGGENSDSWLNR